MAEDTHTFQEHQPNCVKLSLHPSFKSMADLCAPEKDVKTMVRLEGDQHWEYVYLPTLLKSNFLRKAYEASKEVTPQGCRRVRLSFYDSIHFYTTKIYFEFLRTGTLQNASWSMKTIFNLYTFGDEVEDVAFRDTVMDKLLDSYRTACGADQWLPDDKLISRVYNDTEPGSLLRKFIVDVHLWANSAGPEDDAKGPSCGEFLQDLIAVKVAQGGQDLFKLAKILMKNESLASIRTTSVIELEKSTTGQRCAFPANVSACDYHLHERDALCGNRKRKRAAEAGAAAQYDPRNLLHPKH